MNELTYLNEELENQMPEEVMLIRKFYFNEVKKNEEKR